MTRIQLISPFEGYLDVADGTKFPITKSVSEIKDLSKRKTDITKTCVLAGTENNNVLLGNFFNVNIVANQFNPNVKVLCNVLQDDVLVMENAYLQLLSINRSSQSSGTADQEIEYEVMLSSSRANLMQLVKQKEVQDIDFSEFNHVYNRANVIATSGNTWVDGYKYHRAFKGDTSGVYLTDFKAGIFFKTVFDKIHEANGFQYDFDEMSATTFEQLFIPYSGPRPRMSQVDVDLYSVRSSLTGSSVNVLRSTNINGNIIPSLMYQYPLATNNEIQDNSNSFNPATAIYTSDITARYNASVDISYDVILSSTTNAYMKADGTYVPSIPVGIKHNTFIELYKNGNIGAGISTAVASAQAPEIFYTVNDGNLVAGTPKTIGSFNGSANIVLPLGQAINIGDYLAVHLKTNIRPGSGSQNAVSFVTTSGGTTAATVSYSVRINSINITISPVAEELNLGQTVVMNEFLPTKLKQIDVLNTFLKLYNVYSIDNPDDPNTIIYKTRDKFYDDGAEQDWTDIFAVDRQHTIKLLSESQNKRLILKYKDDSKDSTTSNYKSITSESFGQTEFIFDNEFSINEEIIEIPPSTTAMIVDGYGDIVPSYLMSNPECDWRLLLDNDWVPCQGNGWDFIESTPSDAVTYNMYPLLHHWNDPYFPTQDIHFSTCDYYFYNNYTITNNNIFNQYWRRTVNNWNVGKVMEGWFDISSPLFNKTKLSDRIFIKDAWWNIVEIKDYDANAKNALTKVVLISVDDDIRFKNFNSRIPFILNPTDTVIGNPIKEIMDKEILNNNVFVVGGFGSTVNGVNNVVSGKYNTVLGNTNIVTGEKSTIIGDNNVIGVNRSIILGDNVTATTENTAYLQNVEISNNLIIQSGATIEFSGATISGLDYLPLSGGQLTSGAFITTNTSTAVAGGFALGTNNSSASENSFIAGGKDNTAGGYYGSFIGAGVGNTANGDGASIIGGYYNIANGAASTVAGGVYNSATTNSSSVIGGRNNLASGNQSIVAGGKDNVASYFCSFVIGGGYAFGIVKSGSTASGINSGVIGGRANRVSADRSVVIGGQNINATADDTVYVPNLTIKSGSTLNLTDVIISGFSNPGFIVQDTKANIETLRNSGQLLEGVIYYLTDKRIFLLALNSSNLSSTGWRLQTILSNTPYVPSGIIKGMWRSTLSVSINDIVVWGGKTWRNLTGAVGTSTNDTALDGTNWSVNSSYNVNKIFNIVYDWDNDYIVKQIDDNGNEYSCPIGVSTLLGFNPVDISDWGNDKIFSNKCYGVFNNYNTGDIYNNSNRGRISNNIIDEIYDNSNIGNIVGNTSSSTSIYFNSNIGSINSNNNIGGGIYFNTNLGDISSNSCTSGSISIYSNANKGYINSNQTALGDNLNIYNNYNNGFITRNTVSSVLALTVNIYSNINNGNIGTSASDTARTVDITDTTTNK